MTDELRSAALRAMRAWLGLGQAEVMTATGLSQSTLTAAEKGDLSDKTWTRLATFYSGRGVEWREGEPGIMVAKVR